ncbi:hypothetical protein EQV77_09215 [Halobacillus fulvus]|nr:hypothetical protein EQV77_09215 [Halobacillus fulvus]
MEEWLFSAFIFYLVLMFTFLYFKKGTEKMRANIFPALQDEWTQRVIKADHAPRGFSRRGSRSSYDSDDDLDLFFDDRDDTHQDDLDFFHKHGNYTEHDHHSHH